MNCMNCFNLVNSKEHFKFCKTVHMFQKILYTYNDLSIKPVMTYGLNGCIAVLIVIFDIKSNSYNDIHMIHTPIISDILNYISDIYNTCNW